MKVQLFIPCYVDQFYPNVAVATLQVLQKLGCEVDYPVQQTCCGQPMANAGYAHYTDSCDSNFISNFSDDNFIVCPSGSCTLHIKEHLRGADSKRVAYIREHIYELAEFITDVLQVKDTGAEFPHSVGYHTSCHGQRGLMLSSMSEIVADGFSKPAQLLNNVKGLQLIYPERMDECCGFGGTFCITEEALSVKMGKDKLKRFIDSGVSYITGNDMSCLMHLQGLISRNNYPLQVIHLAEILNQ